MASRIVYLTGGFLQRQATSNAITEGLFHLQSGSNYGCYNKQQVYPHWWKSDLITVLGESRVVDRLPDEPADEFRRDKYWASDHIVVLEKPDTELFRIAHEIPTYPAEAGMVHGFTAIGAVVAGFLITTIVAWLFGAGPWSLALGLLVAGVVSVAFWYEMRIRILIATLRSMWYIHKAISIGRGDRVHYLSLALHLSQSDHRIVSEVYRRVFRWM